MRLLKYTMILAVFAAAGVAYAVLVPYGPSAETFVEIAPGTGTAGIARQLDRSGIVRSRYVFEAMKALRGGSLKAGEYRFGHQASMLEVYDRLRRGDVYTVEVVVPEGYNLFDVAAAVQRAGLAPQQEFLQSAMTHVELIRQWSPHARSLEGYLFPDTYRFSRHATPLQMQAAMVKRFGQEMQRLGVSHPTHDGEAVMNGPPGDLGHPTDVASLVTMASLVEKEVHFDDERAEVASVFENRLAAGMPLQTDPAVIYASLLRGTWTGVIHQSELHSDSAYNTYAHTGLPPGPICSPGVAALKAALHPAKTEYLYFVADASGRTRFSTTLGEHNGNVAAYRMGK